VRIHELLRAVDHGGLRPARVLREVGAAHASLASPVLGLGIDRSNQPIDAPGG
jgi:hypothetical protein